MKFKSMAQRHAYILEHLEKEGDLRVADLSETLGVSVVTIRKDLKVLEDKNLLFRTHGTISMSNPYTYTKDRNVNEKVYISENEKKGIGALAATLIEPGEAILIASGTTVLQLARSIPREIELTVVTSAMNVALALLDNPNIEIVQLGGSVRKSSTSVTGPYAEAVLENFNCSKLFLGVDGVDLEQGLTTSNMMEAQLNRAMIKSVQKTIVLTDSSKFGKRGFGKICSLSEIDVIVTDDDVDPAAIDALENLGIDVILANKAPIES
jgi:DeoR family transcriptional regulator, aga operon transcriptional repressor|nr:DeoR/GlpR family DNA-binding transcription regulator [uncultured Flavobacterium sp.]